MNFEIKSNNEISSLFLENQCNDFVSAAEFIQNLPYKRNTDKENLKSVFSDFCGTCSTKHALLKCLAIENKIENIQLILGIFKMNSKNTPKIKLVLEQNNLDYLPEAHNYLKINHRIFDFTKPNSSENDFLNDLLEEREIEIQQINQFKINYHKSYLEKWLKNNPEINYSLDELWRIRENCILALS